MRRLAQLVLVSCLVTACSSPGPVRPLESLPTARVTIVTSQPPTLTPSPTDTPTFSEWLFPYTIPGLRQHTYLSGEIELSEPLVETGLFTRYAIRYPSDGLTISGILQVPKVGSEPFPVILMNHGFFSRTVYVSGDGSDRAAEFLNRHGYLTLSSDYRSWGDSDSGPSLFYSGLVIDVINLMNALPSLPQADPERIGLWGHSMGGGVTLKVLAVDTRAKAAVLYSTVSADDADIINRWGPGCIGDSIAGEQRYGCNSSDILLLDLPPGLIQAYQFAVQDPTFLRQVSPITFVEDVTAPVQFHYGSDDGLLFSGTPPEWSQKAYQAFEDTGKSVGLFAYEGEKHSFTGDQWWAFMERSAHFFDKYVK